MSTDEAYEHAANVVELFELPMPMTVEMMTRGEATKMFSEAIASAVRRLKGGRTCGGSHCWRGVTGDWLHESLSGDTCNTPLSERWR